MPEHHDADVNGIRLHYVTEGQGPLLLFLHGFPEFWYAWNAQLAEFGRDYQAVAVDLRGYNLSSKPAELEQYAMPHLVEDVRALADALGARRFVLVGHDWGGVVAWAFAMAHPERLERLVIINAPHPAIFLRELRDNPAQQQASQYMLVFRSPQAEAILSANTYAALLGNLFPMTNEDRAAYIAAWSQPGALTGGLNYYRAARIGPATGEEPPDPSGLLPDATALVVHVPTLVIWGERDTALLTGNLDGLDAYVPNLTIERIPDGSHWVVHERPAPVNAAIRRFLAAPGGA
ncbi:MAG: alpha/beta hydrolase [Ktedonobacterales bacterium]|nr:alpha/beta hydrolase [Ktedonobacterales bacterium]